MFDSQIITAKMEVTVTGEFYDPEASEETLRFCVEQGLIEQYSDVDVKLLKTRSPWISVKDRLPEIDEDVLILYESKVSPRKTGYAITCLKDSFYFGSTPIKYQTPQWNEPWQYFRENNVITYWMPLPEPPKEAMPNET